MDGSGGLGILDSSLPSSCEGRRRLQDSGLLTHDLFLLTLWLLSLTVSRHLLCSHAFFITIFGTSLGRYDPLYFGVR